MSLIGLINWIPFFICFNGFQIYLEKVEDRTTSSKLLLIGSIPILITGLGQYFLGWDQTINLFNGAIIWFIKPIDNLSGLSGLFNTRIIRVLGYQLFGLFACYLRQKEKKIFLIDIEAFSFYFLYINTCINKF